MSFTNRKDPFSRIRNSIPNFHFRNYLTLPKIAQKVEISFIRKAESMSGYLPDRYSGRHIEKFNNHLKVTPFFAHFAPKAGAETYFKQRKDGQRTRNEVGKEELFICLDCFFHNRKL